MDQHKHKLNNANDKSNSAGSSNKTKLLNCRVILGLMAFSGFAIETMIRISMNIAIFDMIAPRSDEVINDNLNNGFKPECYNLTETLPKLNKSALMDMDLKLSSNKGFSLEKAILTVFGIDFDENGFNWNEHEVGHLLGSGYWLTWLSSIPVGILAKKYGPKLIIGQSILISCLINIFIPITSYISVYLVSILRASQGLLISSLWPAMHQMAAQWVPPNERSKFFSSYFGSSMGNTIFYPIFGYILKLLSWEWVFHLSTIVGIIWFLCWEYLIYNFPGDHPRIDANERDYIENSLKHGFQSGDKRKTPWKAILTSKPVWSNAFIQFGVLCGIFLVQIEAPMYFNVILGWDTGTTGTLSGLPHLSRIIFAICFSIYADHLLSTNKMSRKKVRILFGLIATFGFGSFLVALAYSGCNSYAAVAFMVIGTSFAGAISTSSYANLVDLSPNFAGILMGVTGLICVTAGFLVPYFVSIMIFENQTLEQWKNVFLVTAVILIASGVQYGIFTEVDIQDWNTVKLSEKCKTEELEMLNGSIEKLEINVVKEKM